MALLKIHSRMWLIPIFVVLLLWGCGYDTGLVNGDDHARVVVDTMPNAVVEFNSEFDEEDGTTFTFSGNSLDIMVHNYPRLGDEDLVGGGLLAEVTQVIVRIEDASGLPWPSIPYQVSYVLEPNTSETIQLTPLFSMDLRNEIVRRFLTEADMCNTYFDNFDRLELSEFTMNLSIGVTERTYDGHDVESYTIHEAGSANLLHTGDIPYPLTTPWPAGTPGCFGAPIPVP